MGSNFPGNRYLFRPRRKTNLIKIYFLVFFILIGAFIFREVEAGDIKKPFLPTPTPTRTANSFAAEGETYFLAGDITGAIAAYGQAANLEPNNSQVWSELARIQTYSSSLLTTDAEKKLRLEEAMQSAERAVEVNPDDSSASAILALVYDWYAIPLYAGEEAAGYLLKAEQASVKSLQLNNQNPIALAVRAEIFLDQFRYIDALDYAERAVQADPTSMDVHRVYGFVMESLGNSYEDAIVAYQKAVEINPNFTFLYLKIGQNYRQLKLYDEALESFVKAAKINEQIKVKDPIPYLAIARTYVQQGEFFIAARNVMKALEFTPGDPAVYAQLGDVYHRSRNYEGAILAFDCALDGCTAKESCIVRQDCSEETPDEEVPDYPITGLPLTSTTVVYYYTYGSELSALHIRTNNYCDEAYRIFDIVRTQFVDDAGVMSIVTAGEAICEANEVVR
jgi:tetratricopeptide (TPR) repeat protein